MATAEKQLYQLPDDAVWFITGCSSGIGQALAQHIASHPTHRLVVTARNTDTLSYLPTTSPNILALALDVTSPTSIESALSLTLSRFSRIDIIINNAGYSIMGDAEATPDTLARKLLETNFWGPINIMKRALPILRDTNTPGGGVILNISSMGGRISYPGQAFYHASKFALEGYTESLAKELSPAWNIHLSLIEPGGVQTQYATSSMVNLEPHPAYKGDDMPTRVLERYIADPKARESWADAEEVARAIYGVVEGGKEGKGIPLRVPLGSDAWGVIKMEHERVGRELEEGKALALSVGREEQMRNLMALGK